LFQPFDSFLSSLQDVSEEGYEYLLKKPLFLLGQQGGRVREMFAKLPARQAVTIYAGVLWVIPGAMVQSYLSLYMVDLGLSKTEVSVYPSLARVLGPLCLFLGGYLSDVWGRKKSLILFDIISWGGYCLCLALATNKWCCVAAILFMAVNTASGVPYQCLLVEGVRPKQRASVFTVLQMVNLAPYLLFVPLLGGLWVASRGRGPANHEMYWLFAFLAALGIGWRWKKLSESRIFEKSPKAWWHVFGEGLRQYRKALRRFFKKPVSATFFFSKFLDEWMLAAWTYYYALYFVDHLGMKDSNLSVVVLGSAYAAFLTVFFIIPNLSQRQVIRILGLDQILGLAAFAVLLLWGQGSGNVLLVCLLSYCLSAAGGSLYSSVSAAVWMNIMEEKERAKVVAASSAFIQIGLVTVSLAGVLYGHVSPESLLWAMMGLRVLNFVLLRRVAKILSVGIR
jgi:DHA1 family tetracycline resistance protein-like MFS transporter